MEEQRLSAYHNLIQALLDCPLEQEKQILQANPSLVDWELVELLEVGAAIMAQQGNPKANKLRELALQTSAILEKYGNFLMEVMQAATENNYSSSIYSLLKNNLDKLDEFLIIVLQNWARTTLPEMDREEQCIIAESISILSNIIRELNLGNIAINLEIAIAGYQIIAEVYIQQKSHQAWAATQYNLGEVYRNRIKGEAKENMKMAIACFQAALDEFPRISFPIEWARVQNSLGAAYSCRIKGDSRENLEIAIACFQNALEIYTQNKFPIERAKIQNNLGHVYLRLSYWFPLKEKRGENIEKAIGCFQAAEKELSREGFPVEWAMTQNHLGIAYSNCIEEEREENIEKAIAHFYAALEERSPQRFPIEWAMTQHNLGNAYLCHIKKEPQNLKKAIACFQAALEVHTHQHFPVQWSATQHSLGEAYRAQGLTDMAVQAFQLALQVRTPTALPYECLKTGSNLGNTAFNVKKWEIAIEGYSAAIEGVETSRSWTTSESRRQEILTEAFYIYPNIVQACINAGQIEKAFEYAERSRSKCLVDLMASNDLYFGGEIPPQVQHYLQQYEDLQRQIDRERSQNNSGNNRELSEVGRDRAAFQAYSEAIATLESRKKQVWEQIRRLDPVLAGEIQVSAPDFEIMQKLIDRPTTAILSFYTTSNDIHIFVLRQNTITLHTATGQGLNELQNWILQNWLKPYIEKQKTWQSQIGEFLTELSQRLQITELISQQLEGIDELILVPHLALHQIPLAALPIGSDRYLGDKFLIRYTPSCQILQFCQQRGELENNLTYGTIEDATEDLPFASFEGEQIAQLYNIPDSQRLKGRSQATVSNYRQLAKQVQVIHSSHHAQSRIDQPLESVLKLADGKITLGQLLTPRWRLPHLSDVFLSCCETGLGLTRLTDDILTLSTGFLCAGARSVVSTLWSVDDLATAIFSMFYYQYRQQGKSRTEALQQAQIKLRSLEGDTLSTHNKPHLAPLLEAKFKQAESDRKAAQQKRDTYPKDSPAYLQWEQERKERAKLATRIREAQKHLEEYCQKSFPFSDPVYWAAFICAGLH